MCISRGAPEATSISSTPVTELPKWCKECTSVIDQCKMTCEHLGERVRTNAANSIQNTEKPMIQGTC